MKYMVNEVVDRAAGLSEGAKAFPSIGEALRFIRKRNKNKKILYGEKEAAEEQFSALLQERLSTVTLTVKGEPGRRITITAFE